MRTEAEEYEQHLNNLLKSLDQRLNTLDQSDFTDEDQIEIRAIEELIANLNELPEYGAQS